MERRFTLEELPTVRRIAVLVQVTQEFEVEVWEDDDFEKIDDAWANRIEAAISCGDIRLPEEPIYKGLLVTSYRELNDQQPGNQSINSA